MCSSTVAPGFLGGLDHRVRADSHFSSAGRARCGGTDPVRDRIVLHAHLVLGVHSHEGPDLAVGPFMFGMDGLERCELAQAVDT